MIVLLLLAHHDDEFFVSGRIRREVESGSRVIVTYTTWGSAYGASGSVREAESHRALAMLGVAPQDVITIGRRLGVEDGTAAVHCSRILESCREAFDGVPIGRLITVAWEGGHPDHDITHLIARRLATDWHLRDELYEFPLYTAAGAPARLFRVNRFARQDDESKHTRLGYPERIGAVLLARCYRSQWRSFVGLLPEAAARYLILGQQQLRIVPDPGPAAEAQPLRPHPGPLFYERRFYTSFESLLSQAASLIETGTVTGQRGPHRRMAAGPSTAPRSRSSARSVGRRGHR